MGEKRFAKEPLLYIHQPNIRKPEARMQDHYYTSNKQNRSENNVNISEPTRKRSLPLRRSYFSELLQGESEIIKNKEQDVEEVKVENHDEQSKTKEKPFKDMSNIERIHYFLNVPEHIPKMKCEIETDKTKYRGIITDFKDKTVYMQTGSRLLVSNEIPLNDIRSIQLLGF